MRKETKISRSDSNFAYQCIATAGEVFPDGASLELVSSASGRSPELLLWARGIATVAEQVVHDGTKYKALPIDSTVFRAMRLPDRCLTYGSTRQLFASVAKVFTQHLGLKGSDAALLAHFAFSSWFPEFLSAAPWLSISGVDSTQAVTLLRVLGCVCRRALLLADITPRSFRWLPMTLRPTLLISQPDISKRMGALMRSSAHPGFYVPGLNGAIAELFCARAIFVGTGEMDSSSLQISLGPAQLTSLNMTAASLERIASELQPQMLMYRLLNWQKVQRSNFDVVQFNFRTRELARNLGACVPDEPELAQNLATILQNQDEDARVVSGTDVFAVLTEILLAHAHSGELREVPVSTICKDVNVTLRARGELIEYSPVEIGWKLRALGIGRHRTCKNHCVVVSRELSRRVHRFAHQYGIASARQGCHDCATLEQALPGDVVPVMSDLEVSEKIHGENQVANDQG